MTMKRRKIVTAEHCLLGEFGRRELAKRLESAPSRREGSPSD